MGHSEHGFQGFYSLLLFCHKSCTGFPKLVRSLFTTFASFFALSLWPLDRIFWGTQFHSIYSWSDNLPGFLNTVLFFFSISYVLNETLSLLGFLYVCTMGSSKGGLSPIFLENFSLFVLLPKIRRSCLLRWLYNNTQ